MIFYFVTPDIADVDSIISLVTTLARGGITVVQYRSSLSDMKEKEEIALAIKKILVSYGIPLIINNDLDLAVRVKAEGIHLGQNDISVPEAKKAMPSAMIGLSLNEIKDFDKVLRDCIDPLVQYYAVSPLFSTVTKDCQNTPWGLEELKKLRKRTQKSIIAIGGITLDNVKEVIEAGADGIAAVSLFSCAKDPLFVIQELRRIFS
ncbi:MAG: thiamine phosphate synthase [Desulfovibrionaceae bacterium]